MNADLWKRVDELLQGALALPPDLQEAFLRRHCGEDAELFDEVRSLLAADHEAGSFLQFPGPRISNFERLMPALEPAPAPLASGDMVSRYRLLEPLGSGGMGEVWLAEQTEPVRRRVALKLVKAGMNIREVILRFESERQALALMDHPAIAKVFDAGSTPSGAPYFVMELVAGVPITTYCDNHRLNVRERLKLFVQVCDGVQHAHQKAIIHRDLKPSNVLVQLVDGNAAPKIIDFGLAKALTQKLTVETMFTRVGSLIGTPEYMSPEQVRSAGEDIDTRTDVYSLGMILYELLAGAPPLDLRNASLEELLRRIREEEPPKPSSKIRTHDRTKSIDIARKRQTETTVLVKLIRGELDSIALKALEKERSRRYASPSDLALDIRRYLNHEAVLAVPPSLAYQTHKFARRHRAALITACAFVLVLIAAATFSIRQGIVARKEAAVAEAVNDFLQNDLLAQASRVRQSQSGNIPEPDLKVRTALDRAAERVEGKFADQPEVEASIRSTIARAYAELGLYTVTRKQLERTLELQTRVFGAENPKTLDTRNALGWTLKLQGNLPEAEAQLRDTVAARRRALGPEHRDTLKSMINLTVVYAQEGKYQQAEALDNQVLEIGRRVLGPEHPETLMSMSNLAWIYQFEGKYQQAEALDSQVLALQRRVLGPEHLDTLNSLIHLAEVYESEGKYAQAEMLDDQVLEIRRRVLGPEHPDTLISTGNLAAVYESEGKYPQAEMLDNQVLEIRRRVLGPEHLDTMIAMGNLAMVYSDDGKYEEAEALDRQVLEVERHLLGPEHPTTLTAMNNLADDYAQRGEYTKAEALFSQTVAIARRVQGPEHPDTLLYLSDFATMCQRRRNFQQAQKYAEEVLAGRRHTLGSEDTDTMNSAADLALAYISQGKSVESEPLAREAMETDKKQQPTGWQRFRAESLLGESLAEQKKYAQAEPLLLEGYHGMLSRKDRIGVPDRYHLQLAHRWLVDLYREWGKPQSR
jgi:serine/threonine protein kinase